MARIPKPSGKKGNFGEPKQVGDLRRSVNIRLYQKKIILVVEGDKTERGYFINLKQTFRKLTLHVEVHPGSGKHNALNLVECAIELQGTNKGRKEWDDEIDQMWVVCDTEGDQNKKIVQSASLLAFKKNINLALTNPCFEYWAILHYRKTSRPFLSPEEAKKYLRDNFIVGYNESMDLFTLTKDIIHVALANVHELRIANLDHWNKNLNPSTSIDGLITVLINS